MRHAPINHLNRRAARGHLKLCRALLSAFALAVLLAPHSTAQTRADAAAAGEQAKRGAITGRVVGEDGQPLSNARVLAGRMVGAPGFAASALSDDEGKFTLGNLVFGAYLVNAFAPGYLLEPDPLEQSGARTYQHVGDSVTLRLIKGGVITGTVTDAGGEPVVGVFVDASRVRDADGRALREWANPRIWQARLTDDRGVYRIYGLRPGAYIVRVGGKGSFPPFTPYDPNAPTYYPSATRDVATEVSVQAGQEASGIDIRYRGEAGRTISGTVSGALPPNFSANGGSIVVALKHVSAGAPELFFSLSPGNTGFAFDGIADGDYDLLARPVSTREDFAAASPPRRVSVRGRDVTGVTLALAPLGSVSGQLLFDPPRPLDDKHACQPARAPRAEEAIVAARRDDAGDAVDQGRAFFPGTNETAPGDKGEFQLRHLKAGRYQLLVRLPDADFYVRAVALANAPAKNPPTAAPVKSATPAQAAGDQARVGFSLQTGERLSGLNIHVAAGAAGLRGRVAAAADGAGASPAGVSPLLLRVHLVPAERELADNLLRYAESHVAADGTFAFANLAPGRYWLLARPARTDKVPPDDAAARPLARDVEARARLRRDAEIANASISLAPCQRINDFVLPHPAR
ncbi:MAG TPA: carboxypeptidase-like regulatory domain-containing protein [Pyrinomonadaceae bacterium]|nr:carboxypeptidase-like regulatory domain-containing protein [Pyrinomonadaceae bacterium]